MITSFFVRLYNALIEARMRAAMRELDRHPALRRAMIAPVAAPPAAEVNVASRKASYADMGMLPFVRGA